MDEKNKNTAELPAELLEHAGIRGHKCNVSLGEGLLLILKKEMTMEELLKAYEKLTRIANGLISYASCLCDECDHCDNTCFFGGRHLGRIDVPEDMREKLGFAKSEIVRAMYDHDEDRVVLAHEGQYPELRGVSRDTIDYLREMEVCFASLSSMMSCTVPVDLKSIEEDGKNE